ncbi:MAG: tRNA (adenosine(37)-N6)-threonylcarbamoyltransferase complex transferase subunit TsaD, partial [Nitrospirae bacterium]|nr:tRNA (adenosine(37)-N6)-threonylcarbamoyltransferase complex transferase subunit TsaD [Nitrospirota bacterium]
MLILGIDTSCDDTTASVVEDGVKIISNVVSTQDEVHKKYGGIVPELASRRHVEMILPVVDGALKQAGANFKDLSAIAVCYGPGLIGSLLIGVCFAKALSYANKIPMVAVNHLEGHIFSAFLEKPAPEFPFLALIVSGGHTNLYRVDDFGAYKELARTRDDAAGEAFDKVAKLLGLGYPGGPIIDKMSEKGNTSSIQFPRAFLRDSLDFSFSGLKTAVMNFLKIHDTSLISELSRTDTQQASLNNIAASFQSAVIDVLIKKTIEAAKKEGIKRIVLSGGVSANSALRGNIVKFAEEDRITVCLPPIHLCTDNGAMIASAGFHHFKAGNFAD